jgi:hypothetical protein
VLQVCDDKKREKENICKKKRKRRRRRRHATTEQNRTEQSRADNVITYPSEAMACRPKPCQKVMNTTPLIQRNLGQGLHLQQASKQASSVGWLVG